MSRILLWTACILILAGVVNSASLQSYRCSCSLELKPVCGSYGETYLNQCGFNCAKSKYPDLSFLCEGKCPCPVQAPTDEVPSDTSRLPENL